MQTQFYDFCALSTGGLTQEYASSITYADSEAAGSAPWAFGSYSKTKEETGSGNYYFRYIAQGNGLMPSYFLDEASLKIKVMRSGRYTVEVGIWGASGCIPDVCFSLYELDENGAAGQEALAAVTVDPAVHYTGADVQIPLSPGQVSLQKGKEYLLRCTQTAQTGNRGYYLKNLTLEPAAQEYAFTLETDNTDYNAGETVTATAYLSAQDNAFTLGTLQAKVAYDTSVFEYLSAQAENAAVTVNQVGDEIRLVGIDTANGAISATGKTALATIKLRVKNMIATGSAAKELSYSVANAAEYTGVNWATTTSTPVTVNVHNLTASFAPGEHGTLSGNPVIYYAKCNAAGLYTDNSYQTPATEPKLTPSAPYRVADKPWSNGTANYSWNDLPAITENASYTAQYTEQITVIFTEGEHGTIASGGSVTIDKGNNLALAQIPTPAVIGNYVFAGWKLNNEGETITSAALAELTMDSSASYTAQYKEISYNVTTPNLANCTIEFTSGVTAGKAGAGTAINFTVKAANANYDLTTATVSYTVDGGAVNTLPATANGQYTIPGTAVTGEIAISASLVLRKVTVTFVVGTNGAISSGNASVVLDAGSELGTNIPEVTPTNGYVFIGWKNGLNTAAADTVVTENIEYTAEYQNKTYNAPQTSLTGATVNYVSGYNPPTYGTDLVFTVTPLEGYNADTIRVSYTIGEGEEHPLSEGAESQYTIPGSAVLGDVTITVTLQGNLDAVVTVESGFAPAKAGYAVAKVVPNTPLGTNEKYVYTNGAYSASLFYSEKYKAYVGFIPDSDAEPAEKITVAEGTATVIAHGSIMGDDAAIVDMLDAMWIYKYYKNDDGIYEALNPESTEDAELLFKLDYNGDMQITVADVQEIVNAWLGMDVQ